MTYRGGLPPGQGYTGANGYVPPIQTPPTSYQHYENNQYPQHATTFVPSIYEQQHQNQQLQQHQLQHQHLHLLQQQEQQHQRQHYQQYDQYQQSNTFSTSNSAHYQPYNDASNFNPPGPGHSYSAQSYGQQSTMPSQVASHAPELPPLQRAEPVFQGLPAPRHQAYTTAGPAHHQARPMSTDANRNRATKQKSDTRRPVVSASGQMLDSPSASSPTPTLSAPLVDSASLLICVGEDCLSQAHRYGQQVAETLEQGRVGEYHKLVATGLGCLEAALQSGKLAPRVEAKIRLRYASILGEETENLMEAETALTKGITLCEKHRFADLKYCMQFLLLKVLFQRSRKAALKAVDGHISDCTTFKHVHWVYAFRLLKAAFYLDAGNAADAHAIENLRTIGAMASHRGDIALCVMAALLEGLTHLKTAKDDAMMRVQACIAQASKYQLDSAAQIPQIDILILLLDLACSLQQKMPGPMLQKLRHLQSRMDGLIQSHEWDDSLPDLLLPVKKPSAPYQTISSDTGTILRPGEGSSDYLVMSFVSKVEAFILGYIFSGLAMLYKNGSSDRKVLDYWTEALRSLATFHSAKTPQAPCSLKEAISRAQWRSEVGAYIHVLLALHSATCSNWVTVEDCMRKLEGFVGASHDEGPLALLTLYLSGAYYQGTGNLEAAMRVFTDARFSIDGPGTSQRRGQLELALLANLNRVWILQEPLYRDDRLAAELVEKLGFLCAQHADPDIRTAYNLVMATIQTNPPCSINQVKGHIQVALGGAKQTSNTHCLSVALNVMRCRLFENVVGEQALKSAKAASAQARRSGNLLWMSVADGMLAQSYEVQGELAEARATGDAARRHAEEAFGRRREQLAKAEAGP